MLLWQATQAELSLLEAFFARESDTQAAQTPDFFLRLQASFALPDAHGYALREELIAQYAAAKPQLEAQGIEASWLPPYARPEDDDVHVLLGALSSFHGHHERDITLLAVWLDPSEADAREPKGAAGGGDAYLAWLQRLARAAGPKLRFFLVDTAGACAPLARAEPRRVQLRACDLDVPQALGELAQQAGQDTPGGKFRALFLELAAVVGAGSVELAEALAQSAGALACAHGWQHLAAGAQICLASGYALRQRHLDALRCYTEAERLGAQAEDAARAQPEPAESAAAAGALAQAQRVRLQARFGQGAALVAHGAWAHAADVYLAAFQLADAVDDARSQLDCLRLSSVCFVRAGEQHKAWAAGLRALSLGANLDAETRSTSSFPYLCDHLLRMTEQPEFGPQRAPLEQQTSQLLGPDWRVSLAAPG